MELIRCFTEHVRQADLSMLALRVFGSIQKELELINSISMKLKDFELSIWFICDGAKDILQTVGSIAVQAMVFNDREKLGNEAAGQTSVDETDEWEVN